MALDFPERERNYVVEGSPRRKCGNHSGGRSLAGKVLRQGYFWPYLTKRRPDMVRRCKEMPRTREHHACSGCTNANSIPNPCPFFISGYGPDRKIAKSYRVEREYLIVVVDYFSKWVEAEPLSKIFEKEIIKFVWRNIVCRFGISRAFVTDNGTQFQGKEFKRWCLELKIKQYFTSVGTPQSNEKTEVTNRTILQHLKGRLDKAKGNWVDELPGVLWAYKTNSTKKHRGITV
ncbi:UNVERIFIED_CONTAM: hypothetical protein Sradi_3238400 [Sesamum radiatum]|uniref:Integrase catalytic domain-containing protein n=1 Tax=Sesamum radiatum TaxID=300843 RepID=A0AAW2RGY4_SESRA